jgi:hypothetical protein
MDSDLANGIMTHQEPESLFINGMLVEIRYGGGRRNTILTLRTDYELYHYDIVQCLIGIVLSKSLQDPSYTGGAKDINHIREKVGDIY